MVRYYKAVTLTVFLGFLVVVGNKIYQQQTKQRVILKVERQERLLEELGFLWKSLAKDVENLSLPGLHSKKFFHHDVTLHRIKDFIKVKNDVLGTQSFIFSTKTNPEEGVLSIWKELLSKVQYFEYVKLFAIKGELNKSFIVDMKLDALAKSHDNKFLAVNVEFSITVDNFKKVGEVKIKEWKNKKIVIHERESLLFRNTTENVLSDKALVDFARSSEKEAEIAKFYSQPSTEKARSVIRQAHPSAVVVDINNDKWDDLYICGYRGKSVFMENDRGVFRPKSINYLDGEDIGHAIFADFDNDGDQDAFIASYYGRAMYLINEKGKYTKANQKISGKLPLFTMSFSVVDYNNDGLLDIYIATFAPQKVIKNNIKAFFSEKEISDYRNFLKDKVKIVDYNEYNISKNVLLKNLGNGEFENVTDSPLALYKSTHQVVWSDLNGDGKQDIYVANDFSKDLLFFNLGNEKFQNVSHLLDNFVAFSMGASCGDYNNDEKIDIYVTSMYSKAGTRIIKEITPVGLENYFFQSAIGNYLVTNEGQTLQTVTGLSALWSWGSQFIDIDNDGYLDIYAPCGHYTTPKIFDNAKDT